MHEGTHSLDTARRLLAHHFGFDAFRPAQARVVRSVLAGRDTLAILPTGGGKSICFQIPALVLGGLTVVVSPLISLMQDQVDAGVARGLPALSLHSAVPRAAQRAALERIAAGADALLYVSPERLERLTPELTRMGIRPRLLVVDEAHCIAEWGHDFRPSYRRLRRARRALGQPQTLALTGSATPEVRTDIADALGLGGRAGYDLHLGSFDRRNLWFGVVRVRNDRERLARLFELLRGDDRTAIVYAPTRGTTEAIAVALGRAGYRVTPYHAGLGAAARREALDAFLSDRVEIVVATCAFGMGIDKPTVRLVVHWQTPPTPESYYQEAGRAGRDGAAARCILLHGPDDGRLHRRQLDVTFPPRRLLERIWCAPDGRVGVPANVLDAAERLRRELRPERGPVDWRPVDVRRRRAEARIAAMEHYAGGRACRRARLLDYFGERLEACAGCDRCRREIATPVLPAAAGERLRRLHAALSGRRAGGAVLDAVTLVRLALRPPASAAALADVRGVGPAVAERLGGRILAALGPGAADPARDQPGEPPSASLDALRAWRADVVSAMAVAPFVVVGDEALRRIADAMPATPQALRRVGVLGPRALAKHGDAILAALDRGRAPPVDEGGKRG